MTSSITHHFIVTARPIQHPIEMHLKICTWYSPHTSVSSVYQQMLWCSASARTTLVYCFRVTSWMKFIIQNVSARLGFSAFQFDTWFVGNLNIGQVVTCFRMASALSIGLPSAKTFSTDVANEFLWKICRCQTSFASILIAGCTLPGNFQPIFG